MDTNVVRIFISSTFSDFEEERNALQQDVFPRLKEYCEERGLQFQPVDLRWGVSEKDAQAQQTMAICMDELERCKKLSSKPNFLFLLGDRYGWQPLPVEIEKDELEQILVDCDQESVLTIKNWYKEDCNFIEPKYILINRDGEYKEYKDWEKVEKRLRDIFQTALTKVEWAVDDPRREKYLASATEQEIIEGALLDAEASEHVLCIMRSIDNLTPETKKEQFLYVDTKGNHVDESAQSRLNELKKRITTSLTNNIHSYTTSLDQNNKVSISYLKQLCNDVYDSVSNVIAKRTHAAVANEKSVLPPMEHERMMHNDFANKEEASFTGRTDELEELYNLLEQGSKSPLLVYGESGIGKSSVLAKLSNEIECKEPQAYTIKRFIGATPTSFDSLGLIKSILYEVSNIISEHKRTGNGGEQGNSSSFVDTLNELVSKLLKIPFDQSVFIFLDGINQLLNQADALQLFTRLSALPNNIRVICSCTKDYYSEVSSDILILHSYELTGMKTDHARELLKKWLVPVNRTLQDDQERSILSNFNSNNSPLYLKLIFEKAKHWRSWEQVNVDEIRPSISGVIQQFLEDLEHKFGTIMAEHALSYLALSRHGLTEQEWIHFVCHDKKILDEFKRLSPSSPQDIETLPIHIFARFISVLRPYIREQAKKNDLLFTIFHSKFKQVMMERYLFNEEKVNEIRNTIINYFDYERSISNRKVDEFPWQLQQAGKWNKLVEILVNPNFYTKSYTENKYETMQYWSEIERKSSYNRRTAYSNIFNDLDQYDVLFLEKLVSLLGDTTKEDHLIIKVYKNLIDRVKNENKTTENVKKLIEYYHNLALQLQDTRDKISALQLYKEIEDLCGQIGDSISLAKSFLNHAKFYYDNKDLKNAFRKIDQAEKIFIENDIRDEYYATCLSHHATFIIDENKSKAHIAITKMLDAIKIVRDLQKPDALMFYLINIASMFEAAKDYEKSIDSSEEALSLALSLGYPDAFFYEVENLIHLLMGIENWVKTLTHLELLEENALKLNNSKMLNLSRVLRNKIEVTLNIKRNDPCLCGSGKKYKKCHGS